MFFFFFNFLFLIVCLFLVILIFILIIKIFFQDLKGYQKELYLFYKKSEDKLAVIEFQNKVRKQKSIFFNEKIANKILYPSRGKDLFFILRNLNNNFFGIEKLTNFFNLIFYSSNVPSKGHKFFLKSKGKEFTFRKNFVRVEYLPDKRGNFFLNFKFFKLREVSREVQKKESKSLTNFRDLFKRWEIFFVFSFWGDKTSKDINFIVKNLEKKLKMKRDCIRWVLIDDRLVIFVENSSLITRKLIDNSFKKHSIKNIFILNSHIFLLKKISLNFLMELFDNLEYKDFFYDWRIYGKYSYKVEINLHIYKKVKSQIQSGVLNIAKSFYLNDKKHDWITFLDEKAGALLRKTSTFVKERLVDIFFQINHDRKRNSNIFIEVTFQHLAKILRKGGNFFPFMHFVTPFLIVNEITRIDPHDINIIFLVKNLNLGIRLNTFYNKSFFENLNLIKPKYIFISKNISTNLNNLFIWFRFRFISETLKKIESKPLFIFEGLKLNKLDREKQIYISNLKKTIF